jgi:hypothetical protein
VPDTTAPHAARTVVSTDTEDQMLDFLFSVGQTASVLLLLYGAFLVARHQLPAKKPLSRELEDELLLLKHIRLDA